MTIDITDIPTIDSAMPDMADDEIVVKPKKSAPANDGYGATPVEDRHGRPLWVQTRQCFCDDNAETDCRFHSPTEPGWEQCPNTEVAAKSRKRGLWLWARNPMYGKPLSEEEQQAVQAVAA